MLPSQLLMHRYKGDEVVPKRLPLDDKHKGMAADATAIFERCVGQKRGELDEQLQLLEGTETDYRVKRGLVHLLHGFADFETVSPLEPERLRELVFSTAAPLLPSQEVGRQVVQEVAERLSTELERTVPAEQVEEGLYADLLENQTLVSFDAPTPETLLHRYNLSQAQGVLYRASDIVITAYRNDPGEYKQLFKFLKLFGLMSYIEGDAEHGFTVTIDGPDSLFKPSTRYGTDLAKFLPALLQVSRWRMEATLVPRQTYDSVPAEARFSLDDTCGLVSHYKRGKTYDSIVEESFAKRWDKTQTPWKLEREVELVSVPGSVMVPDFRLVHPDGRTCLLEIVGYWRPEYLKKKFAQVKKSLRDDLVLAISERLNLGAAGIKLEDVPAKIVWFKGKVNPKDVLEAIGLDTFTS